MELSFGQVSDGQVPDVEGRSVEDVSVLELSGVEDVFTAEPFTYWPSMLTTLFETLVGMIRAPISKFSISLESSEQQSTLLYRSSPDRQQAVPEALSAL